ncbi:MAG: AAA family ATPase, partial [Bacilli bacterium]|nr:AAA family ATPase [Bacilli bacterium]
EKLKKDIEERKLLEYFLSNGIYEDEDNIISLNANARLGIDLLPFVKSVKEYKKRNGYTDIKNFIYSNKYNNVFILYGLRRTGKTTLIKQIISDMTSSDLLKTAFIQVTKKDSLASLNKDLKTLEDNGYQYIFIDEVTLLEDFIEGASLLSDIYASVGMKIVLSGTDSLGFWITKSNELYDRCIFLHTTFISYREFSNVLGINGIDDYIQFGGTMSMSGDYYNEGVFSSEASTDEYIDSSIAKNIQHSLKLYEYGGHFRHLHSLYENDELTSAINRVVEDINHRFTIDVLVREFKSNDLRLSANNLRKDRSDPTTILDDIDEESFTKRLKDYLSIKNKEEMTVEIDDIHVKEIEEYLEALDLIKKIDVRDIDNSKNNKKRIVFSQPGLRYSQAKSFIESLSYDEVFSNLNIEEKKRIIERILNEIKGRMIEDLILLETKLSKPKMDVFKLEFSDGEFDMVIVDNVSNTCEIYEIKYSKEQVKEQVRHLVNKEKCEKTEFTFGKITKKVVLYRGENITIDGIEYQNIEDYLLGL